ncbi:hypothetical protein H3C61_03725 [Candidatus Gracilibacteria bacterium]|nr:hypothetical protein [Candidatus Gracilibacteria bacterium]
MYSLFLKLQVIFIYLFFVLTFSGIYFNNLIKFFTLNISLFILIFFKNYLSKNIFKKFFDYKNLIFFILIIIYYYIFGISIEFFILNFALLLATFRINLENMSFISIIYFILFLLSYFFIKDDLILNNVFFYFILSLILGIFSELFKIKLNYLIYIFPIVYLITFILTIINLYFNDNGLQLTINIFFLLSFISLNFFDIKILFEKKYIKDLIIILVFLIINILLIDNYLIIGEKNIILFLNLFGFLSTYIGYNILLSKFQLKNVG